MTALVIRSTPKMLEYDLFSVEDDQEDLLLTGRITNVGSANSEHRYRYGERGHGEGTTVAANHDEAFERLISVLRSSATGPKDFAEELSVVTHRVVHGGETFKKATLITDELVQAIEGCSPLISLRNAASMVTMRASLSFFSTVPQVAVFDTAFYQSLPLDAYLYALPCELYDSVGIRRFGFNGVSHEFAVDAAVKTVGCSLDDLRIVSLHIGEECSAVAVAYGRCVETTTGMTSCEGLPGGTSVGDVDPVALILLMRFEELSLDEMEDLLLNRSGMLGLSGVSPDVLRVIDLANKGDERCANAVRVLVHRCVKAVGALAAVMGGIDLLVFTGIAGCKSARLRQHVCNKLAFMGLELDAHRNETYNGTDWKDIASKKGSVRAVVIPSDEQGTIARQSIMLVSQSDAD